MINCYQDSGLNDSLIQTDCWLVDHVNEVTAPEAQFCFLIEMIIAGSLSEIAAEHQIYLPEY